jgi:hypothetical protein
MEKKPFISAKQEQRGCLFLYCKFILKAAIAQFCYIIIMGLTAGNNNLRAEGNY